MLTTLELCAGAGGQALGFEGAGFEHVALVDNNPHACATLRHNRPDWEVIEADLNDFDAAPWQDVDVIAAGIPCPPFSVAGKQLGANDERDLFPALLRIVRETGPRAVVVENVRGLMMKRFDWYRDKVRAELEDLGYSVDWQLLDAYDYGAPQHRTRSFLVATIADSAPYKWPRANGGGGTVGETLHDLMAEDGWRLADKWAKKANRPAPTLVGGSHKHGGPDLGPTRARAAWAELGVDGLGLANAPPPPSFRGKPRLTIEMTARLQTFPDSWELVGNKTQRYRQVGNALPMKLGRAVARSVARCLKN